MWRWLVIIARDRPELWVTWASFYGGGVAVEVLLDRRQGQAGSGSGEGRERRVRPSRDTELRRRGFLVIPRPEVVGTSR
jgi:hypothetical protein